MIFAAVGTQKFPFNRLIKQLDGYAAGEMLQGEEIFAQTGTCTYNPNHMNYTENLAKSDFEEKIKSCSLLITHSGVGTIISGVRAGKPVIVVPRLKKYGEHVDDHQLDIAKAFSEMGLVIMCGEEDDLYELIKKSRSFKPSGYESGRSHALKVIRAFLKDSIQN